MSAPHRRAVHPDLPVVVRPAALEEILALRHAELRPGLPLDSARFAGDDEPDTIHVGAFLESGEAVGCASVMARPLGGAPAWQLRGMASRRDLLRRGIGARVVALAEDLLRRRQPAPLLWCNARVEAVAFYGAQGWEVVSGVFEVPSVGPHHRMVKRW